LNCRGHIGAHWWSDGVQCAFRRDAAEHAVSIAILHQLLQGGVELGGSPKFLDGMWVWPAQVSNRRAKEVGWLLLCVVNETLDDVVNILQILHSQLVPALDVVQ